MAPQFPNPRIAACNSEQRSLKLAYMLLYRDALFRAHAYTFFCDAKEYWELGRAATSAKLRYWTCSLN
jgi:hypothetical protein